MTQQNERLIEGEIILKDKNKWPELYKNEGLQVFIDQIEKNLDNILKEVPDVETKKGRERIGSIARTVSSSKTVVESPGREYLRQMKAKIKPAEKEIKRFVDWCDDQRDRVLRPRKEWEQREKERVAALEQKVAVIQEYMDCEYSSTGSKEIQAVIDDFLELEPDESFREFTAPALSVWKQAKTKLESALDARIKYEAGQAELQRLRAEQEERERKEREERIAKEAAERAKAEAEAKAKLDAEAAERKANQEREAAAKRESEAKAAQERAEQARIAAEEKAKQDAIEAEERQQAAVKAAEERAKHEAAEAKRKEEEETRRREANKKHRAAINNAALDSLVLVGATKSLAKSIVEAIAKGEVPNVKISY